MTSTDISPNATPVAVFDPGERNREEQLWGDRLIVWVSNITAWLFPLLIVAIVTQVVIRQLGFNQAWLDDLQWWMYGFASLVGFVYAITTDSHVRVDIFHTNYSTARKARFELLAVGWLLLPFLALMTDILFHYAVASWTAGEGSDSPNGLHKLYLLKSTLPIVFGLGIVASWMTVRRNLSRLGSDGGAFAQILAMLPFVYFALERVVHYVLWWFVRLTTDLHPRRIGRDPLVQDAVWYALGALIVVVVLAYLMKRRTAGGR